MSQPYTNISENPILDSTFWDTKYINHQTGWDLGMVSPPIAKYLDQLSDPNLRVLIPGCGNAHEAEYMCQLGFTDITLIDIAPSVVDLLKSRFEHHPQVKVLLGDFFDLEDNFDLIIEQTFFCALHPSLRSRYVEKMTQLLPKGGKLVGLLFDRNFETNPPFGGSRDEYFDLFAHDFVFKYFESCDCSAIPRQDSELFINLIRK